MAKQKKVVKKASVRKASAGKTSPKAAKEMLDKQVNTFQLAAGKTNPGVANKRIAIRPITKPDRSTQKFNEALQNHPMSKGFEFHDFVDCDSPVPPGTKVWCCPDKQPCGFYPKDVCCP